MEKVRLGDVCTIKGGYAFKSEMFTTEGIPIIRIGNITKDGLVIDNDVCYEEEFWEANDNYRIRKNDILIAMSGATVGKSCINNNKRKLLLNQRVASINCYDTTNLKYIFYSIDSENFAKYVLKNSMGCAQPNISLKQISDFEIPLIPIEEQKGIANELDKITDLIDKRKEQLKKLDELVKARFVELFGDPKENPKGYSKRQLKQTCKVITGNTPSRAVSEYYGEHIEWIKTDNIVSGLINPTTATEFLSEKGMAVGRTVEKDSILMACIAGSLSSIGRVCVTDRKVAFNQQINAIVPNDYNILFLYVLLQISKEYLVEEINMALKGILSKSKLEEKVFIVPPMELQEEFAAFVKQTDKSKLEIQKGLEKLELLKKALMQKYFG